MRDKDTSEEEKGNKLVREYEIGTIASSDTGTTRYRLVIEKRQTGTPLSYNKLGFIVGGIAFVVWLVAVIAIIVAIVRGKGNEKEEVTALEEENGVTMTLDFREVINNESLANVRVCFYEGYDNVDGDVIAEYETPDNGEILAQIPEGDYTVSWESDGYYGGYENITVNEDGERIEKRMLTVLTGQKAYILLEWDSDKDLDLYVYNAQIDQYIDTQSGVDTTGSFLYSDNAGEEGYELICLGGLYHRNLHDLCERWGMSAEWNRQYNGNGQSPGEHLHRRGAGI